MKKLIAVGLGLMMGCLGIAQAQWTYTQLVSGSVTDSTTGIGISNHAVHFYYFDTLGTYDSVVTDSVGHYQKTLVFNYNMISQVHAFTYGCNNQMYSVYFLSIDTMPVANFSICVNNVPPCNASFTHYVDGNNPLMIHFLDSSAGNINIWYWNFGDGNASMLQNPVHTYDSQGTYLVQLTVMDSLNPSYSCSFADSIIISYPAKNLSGQVYGGFFPVGEVAKVVLYKVSGNQYLPADTCYTDQDGVYYFYQQPVGEYVVRAIPSDNITGSLYFPTYHSSQPTWQYADLISLYQNLFNEDVTLDSLPQLPYGQSVIQGQVHLITNGSTMNATEVEVLLLDGQMTPLAYQFTDPQGQFLMSGLPEGNFVVRPELPGFNVDYYSFSTSGSVFDTVQAVLNIYGTNASIPETYDPDLDVKVYPNPFVTSFNLEFVQAKPREIGVLLTDVSGNPVFQARYSLPMGLQVFSPVIPVLPPGMYLLYLHGESGVTVRKLVKHSGFR